jgi:hypothetical protein
MTWVIASSFLKVKRINNAVYPMKFDWQILVRNNRISEIGRILPEDQPAGTSRTTGDRKTTGNISKCNAINIKVV